VIRRNFLLITSSNKECEKNHFGFIFSIQENLHLKQHTFEPSFLINPACFMGQMLGLVHRQSENRAGARGIGKCAYLKPLLCRGVLCFDDIAM
jgi:hypothetical protein